MTNYYKFLRLPPNASLADIQGKLKLAAQSGKVPIEILHEIRDTLYDNEKRRAYDAALRQADPAFFQPPAAASAKSQSQSQPKSKSNPQAQGKAQPANSDRRANASRAAPALANHHALLSSRNIILALCALAMLTWLLPWANTPLKSYLGISLNFRLIAWVNTIIFAATAAKVWLDDKQEKAPAYNELMFAALFALLVHAQYYLRVKPFFERLGTPKEVLTYGIGLYAQIIVATLLLIYILFLKKTEQ